MGFFAQLAGQPCAMVALTVPWTGIWLAECELVGKSLPSGSVTLELGKVQLEGTVVPARSGRFADKSRVLVAGGANGWSKLVKRLNYHNETTNGLRRGRIARDAASEVGESVIVAAAVDTALVDGDFLRAVGPASRVLELLFPSSPWWVGLDGVTRVDERPITDVSGKVRILELDTERRRAQLQVDSQDVALVMPGASITDKKLDAPFVVHDVEILVEGRGMRVTALGGTGRDSRFMRAWRALSREADPRRAIPPGPYRYRVFRMRDDRVELQAVNKAIGLPDALPVHMFPSLSGGWSELAEGSIVLLQFIEGDPALPIVSHLERKGQPGFLPVLTTIDATEKVAVGFEAESVELGEAHATVIRNGDMVKITIAGVQAGSSSVEVTAPIELFSSTIGAPPLQISKVKA